MPTPTTPIIIEVWNAIKTKIAVDYATGYSGIDLTNRVFQGKFTDAPLISSAYITFIEQTESNGTALTQYQGDMRFQIYCFNYGKNNFERATNALKLGADIHNALISDRTLGLSAARIDNIIVETAFLDGDEFGLSNTGIAILETRIHFVSDKGI